MPPAQTEFLRNPGVRRNFHRHQQQRVGPHREASVSGGFRRFRRIRIVRKRRGGNRCRSRLGHDPDKTGRLQRSRSGISGLFESRRSRARASGRETGLHPRSSRRNPSGVGALQQRRDFPDRHGKRRALHYNVFPRDQRTVRRPPDNDGGNGMRDAGVDPRNRARLLCHIRNRNRDPRILQRGRGDSRRIHRRIPEIRRHRVQNRYLPAIIPLSCSPRRRNLWSS